MSDIWDDFPLRGIAFGNSYIFGTYGGGYDNPINRIEAAVGGTWDNLAASGSRITETGQLPTVQAMAIDRFDIVVFDTGINDSRYSGLDSAALAAFRANLDLALPLLAKAALVFILTPPRLQASIYSYDPPYNHASDASMAAYSDEIKAAVAASGFTNIHIADMNAWWDEDAGHYIYDGIHPDGTGNALIANHILGGMKKYGIS